MTVHTKRFFLLAGASTLVSGCATRSVEDCDPALGGSFRHYQCYRQREERRRTREETVSSLETELTRLENEGERLRREIDRLRQANADVALRTRQVESAYHRLSSNLPNMRRRTTPVESYVNQLRGLLRDMNAGVDEALAFDPPPDLIRDGALRARYARSRHDAETARRELAAMHAEVGNLWIQYLGGQIGEHVLREVLERIATRLGLRALNPLIALAALIKEIWDALNLAYDTWDTYN